MKILIIPAFFRTKSRPTAGSFFWDQALALQKAGHQVTILYSDTYSVKCIGEYLGYTEASKLVSENVSIYRKKVFCLLKHGMEGHRETFAKEIQKLYDIFVGENEKPDIIHAHCCVWAGYAAMRLSEKTKIPYVITEHATMFQLHRDKISAANNQYIAEAFGKASKVICVSEAFRTLISEYKPKDEMEVIGNVVDCERFYPAKKETQKGISFLTICYMETPDQLYKKGIDILLKAWRNIAEAYPDAKLLIGGGGHAAAKAVEWCREYGISEQVVFLGALERSQVADQMRQCDFFVLPSRYETFGVVYIEAFACGKPVIAAANGGPDEFVCDFNGKLIPPGDVKALVLAMKQMIENSEQYDAEKIRAFAEEQFSAPAIARQLEQVYAKIKKSEENEH